MIVLSYAKANKDRRLACLPSLWVPFFNNWAIGTLD
jgi:hypothetical protein